MALEFKKVLAKPLVATEDMTAEMAGETVEIITAAVDKFLSTENYEKAAQAVKDGMDKKFGPTWHCCIGEGFGYDVTYNVRNMLLLYYGEVRLVSERVALARLAADLRACALLMWAAWRWRAGPLSKTCAGQGRHARPVVGLLVVLPPLPSSWFSLLHYLLLTHLLPLCRFRCPQKLGILVFKF
jgi:dynein light chain 4